MRKNWIVVMCGLFVTVLFFQSCKKGNHGDHDDEIERSIVEWGDIYFIGFVPGMENTAPHYYKNNIAHPLAYTGGEQVHTVDIAVSRSDIYVIGSERQRLDNSSYRTRALFWKNGLLQALNTPEHEHQEANALYIDGDDVYVAGAYVPKGKGGKRVGIVWKNGEPVQTTDGQESTIFKDLYVVGDDIYAVGHENRNGGIVSKYWKNGIAVTLSTVDVTTYTNSITVDGTDIYIGGYADAVTDRSLKLWKNEIPVNLISGRSVIRGGKVQVENGHNYVIGYEQVGSKYEPRLFKDGVEVPLHDPNLRHTYAFDLQVYQQHTLVLGRMDTDSMVTSVLWINGSMVDLHGLESEVALTAFDIAPF